MGSGRLWGYALVSDLTTPSPLRGRSGDDRGMQQLSYASTTLVTTDAVVDALLELVTAIAWQQHSEAVRVPAFNAEGRLLEAQLTLNSGSELVAVPVDREVVDVDEACASDAAEAAVIDIRSRIRERTHSMARPEIENEPPFPFYHEFHD